MRVFVLGGDPHFYVERKEKKGYNRLVERGDKMKEQKTNVMRLLEQKKISYIPHEYPHGDEAVDGLTVARICEQNPEQVFKTLVAMGASKTIYVFVIPVIGELDLKKAAKASNYQIQYSTSKKFTGAQIVTLKGNSRTIKSLKKGKTYYVRVRTCYKSSGVIYRSAWSDVKSIKLK